MQFLATALVLIVLTCFGRDDYVPTAWDQERSNTFANHYGSVEFAFPPSWKNKPKKILSSLYTCPATKRSIVASSSTPKTT